MPRFLYRLFVYFNAVVTESQCVKLRNFLDQNITHKNINEDCDFTSSQVPNERAHKSNKPNKTIEKNVVYNNMNTVSFNIKLPDNYYKFAFTKSHKCTIIEPVFECPKAGITRHITTNQLVYVVKEFNLLSRFRRRVFRLLTNLNSTVLFIVVEHCNGRLIDYAWSRRALRLTWEKVEIENLMSWLSTLGGAFSALGDSFENCAERAGRISKYQLKLAWRCGDPSIIARCKLYYSISLIQKGRLRAAKQMILSQYEYAKAERIAGDDRIYKMCHGIWLKLQYAHSLKKKQNNKSTASVPVATKAVAS